MSAQSLIDIHVRRIGIVACDYNAYWDNGHWDLNREKRDINANIRNKSPPWAVFHNGERIPVEGLITPLGLYRGD